MIRRSLILVMFLVATCATYGQAIAGAPSDEARIKDRDSLAQLLKAVGPDIKVEFHQSQKQPFTFVGLMGRQGVCDSLHIVVSLSTKQTIHVRVYPLYKSGYINIEKSPGVMKQLLRFSNDNFLFWGADDSGDVFAGYNFTLESGFPAESLEVVLRSIRGLDQFVGELEGSKDSKGSK